MKKVKKDETPEQAVPDAAENSNESAATEPSNQRDETLTSEEAADQIQADIESLNSEVADLKDKNLRLMAEFDNYRRRSAKERVDLIKTAGESTLVQILPLIDDFERGLKAMENVTDVQAVKEGVELIYAKFISFLSENGVKSIPTENENFNTDLHEAITTFPAPSEEMKGKIIDCVSKGYTLHEKVIRFSKVVVGE